MATTRAFRSGNSQAVRIPAEMAFDDMSKDLTITRNGDVITIHPQRGSMTESLKKLLAMPVPPTVELIERTEVPDRERY